jgi:hypothetical protein
MIARALVSSSSPGTPRSGDCCGSNGHLSQLFEFLRYDLSISCLIGFDNQLGRLVFDSGMTIFQQLNASELLNKESESYSTNLEHETRARTAGRLAEADN